MNTKPRARQSSPILGFRSQLTSFLLVFLFIASPLSVLAQESHLEVKDTYSNEAQNKIDSNKLDIDSQQSANIKDISTDGNVSKNNESNVINTEDQTKIQVEKDTGIKIDDVKNENMQTSRIGNPDSSTNTNLPSSNIKVLVPEADQKTGALIYSYPITLPEGRNALHPNLSLTYNNQNMEDNSIYGAGWGMSIPSITRLNKTGVANIYTDNNFESSLSGELVLTTGNTYVSKVDNGDFLTYDFDSTNNKWTVMDKNGTRYIFGGSIDETQHDPADSTHAYKFLLAEVRDTNDNYVKYEYIQDKGQIYPTRILYTNHGSNTNGIYEVTFSLEARADTNTKYSPGFPVETNSRVNEIRIKINGETVRYYSLQYSIGDNGNRSLLSSITETGIDEVSLISKTLPPTEFHYQLSTPGWTPNTNITIPTVFVWPSGEDAGVRILDVNGDGLQDIIEADPSTTGRNNAYINNGNGWTNDQTWLSPVNFMDGGHHDMGVRFADINGDNLPDIIYGMITDDTTYYYHEEKHIYINNGAGWTETTAMTLPVLFIESAYRDLGTRIADLNGDGLVDFIVASQVNEPHNPNGVYLNNGNGWTIDPNWSMPVNITNYYLKAHGIVFVDINNDGLTDLLSGDPPYFGRGVYINTGTQFVADGSWGQVPEDFVDGSYKDRGVRFADINSDGLQDIMISYLIQDNQYGHIESKHTYLNTGHGWVEDINTNIPVFFVDPGNADLGYRATDITGSNLADILYSKHVAANQDDQFIYEKNSGRADLLNEIDYPEGGTTTILYKSSAQYRDGSTHLNPNLPFVLDTVYQISNSDGISSNTPSTTTYTYDGGEYFYNNLFDRKFAGFSKITKVDSAGNKTITYFHQGNDTNNTQGEQSDDEAKIGKVYRVEKYDPSGNLYDKTINWWDEAGAQNGTFVKLVRSVHYTYDGNGTNKVSAETYDYDNATGNLIQKDSWGEVSSTTDDGDFSDIGTDKMTETISYVSNTTNNVVGLPLTDNILDNNGNQVRQTNYYYDNLSYGNVGAGNNTQTEKWVAGSTYVTTDTQYNSYGLPTTTTDARGKTTTYAYDTYNLYPVTITNPLSQTTTYTYDYSLGKPKSIVTPNGFTYQTVYDGLDRVIEEKVPGTTSPYTPVVKTTYRYTDTPNAVAIEKNDYLDASNFIGSMQYFDGLHRLIQDRTEGQGSNTYNVKDYSYNTLGLLERESLPYSDSGSAKTSPLATSSPLYTSYEYDALSRPTFVSTSIGTTTYQYDDWTTTVTDGNSHTKIYTRDAYDNLVQVDEDNGTTYTTHYSWSPDKNLLSITDALGNVRNFTYDALGHRLIAEDLHNPSDTTYGVWQYSYDQNGNMTQSVNPRGQTVNYTYDDVNRALSENYTGNTGTEIAYTYDTCQNGIGMLCGVTMLTGANTGYKYDTNGNTSSEDRTINGTTYTTEYVYDLQKNMMIATTPDGAKIRNTYDSAGKLSKVEYKENGGTYADAVSAITYAPTNQIVEIHFPNTVITTNTYDPTQRYFLTHKLTEVAGGTKFQDSEYTYDPVGNVATIIDTSGTDAAKQAEYTYDNLDRLIRAKITNTANSQDYTEDYTYNAIGNLLTKTGTGTYAYAGNTGTNYANPHAPTTIGAISYNYDQSGNLVDDGVATYTWNYKDQLTKTIGSGTSDYWYDHTGARVRMKLGTTDTSYINPLYNIQGTTKTKHLYAGTTLVATIETIGTTTTPHYIHTDPLLGSNITTDYQPKQEQLLDYYPYGDIRINQQITSFDEQRKYGGHFYDPVTDLNYLGARYYQAKRGQFLSEDPSFWTIGADKEQLINPQTQNSYSYAGNNPLKNIDPDGKCFWDACAVEGLILISAAETIGTLLTVAFAADWAGTQLNPSISSDVKQASNAQALDIAGMLISGGVGTGGFSRVGNTVETKAVSQEAQTFTAGNYEVNALKSIKEPYSRPPNATTSLQKQSVQGKNCVNCGTAASKMIADHKTPLMQEYYETGGINLNSMRSPQAVQPQCPTCSAQQGAYLSNISKQIKSFISENN